MKTISFCLFWMHMLIFFSALQCLCEKWWTVSLSWYFGFYGFYRSPPQSYSVPWLKKPGLRHNLLKMFEHFFVTFIYLFSSHVFTFCICLSFWDGKPEHCTESNIRMQHSFDSFMDTLWSLNPFANNSNYWIKFFLKMVGVLWTCLLLLVDLSPDWQ